MEKHDMLAELGDSDDEDFRKDRVVWLFLRYRFDHPRSRALEWWEWVTRNEYEYLRAADSYIKTGVSDHTDEKAGTTFSNLVQRVVYSEKAQRVLETYVETKDYLEQHLQMALGPPETREARLVAVSVAATMRKAILARRQAVAAEARSAEAAEEVNEAEAALEQEVERTPPPSAKKPRVAADK